MRNQDQALLKTVFKFSQARKVKLYIVGGYLRDILLNRRKENPDIDFCIKKGAIAFGRKLSLKIKAKDVFPNILGKSLRDSIQISILFYTQAQVLILFQIIQL